MGYLCVTQSGKAAIDYVKRIERARARKPKSFVTYGFQVREDPRRYVYAQPALPAGRAAHRAAWHSA